MRDPEHLRPFHPDQTVVLVAEDEVLVQNIVRLSLESDGFFVLTAHDGLEALELSRNYSGRIHLLLTDIMMPRMDGLALCGHVQNERPETKLLVMSGTHHPGIRISYLPKPFTTARLREKVRDLIGDGVLFPQAPRRAAKQ